VKITTAGLKANDKTLDLGKLNLVVGANGSGKSSLYDALTFAALGHVPRLGRKPGLTAQLMSRGEMRVELTLQDGRTFWRSLRRSGKSLTAEQEASWVRHGDPADHDEAIKGLFGQEVTDIEETFWTRELLDAPASQRTARFGQLASSGRKTPKEITAQVAHATVQRIGKVDPSRMPKDYFQALPLLKEAEQLKLREVAAMLEGKLKDAGIAGALTWANEEKNSAARTFKDKQAAQKALEERLAGMPEASDQEIAELDAERAKMEREIGAAEEREREVERKAASIRIAKQEMDFAQTRLESAKADSLAAEKLADEIPVLKERLAELDPENLEEIARAKLDTLDELDVETFIDERYQYEVRIRDIENRADRLATNPWVEVRTIARALKRHKDDAVSEQGERLIAIANGQSNDTHEDIDAELAKAKKDRDAHTTKVEAIEARNADLIDKAMKIRTEVHELYSKATKLREQQTDLSSAIQKAERDLERANTALTSATQAHEAAKKRHTELWANQGDAKAPEAVKGQEEAYLKLQAAIAVARRVQASRTELSSIIAEIDGLGASRDVYAGIEWALQQVRAKELTEAGGPLIGLMNSFLKAAGRVETPYLKASKTDCEIGWKDAEGREVSVNTLSGGQWALFSAALVSSILILRDPPLKVLVVEAGEVDNDSMTGILRGLNSVALKLDCVIVLTWDTICALPTNCNVIKLDLPALETKGATP
jgi:DNA repair exonuclease SbcCD ATPase subunit